MIKCASEGHLIIVYGHNKGGCLLNRVATAFSDQR